MIRFTVLHTNDIHGQVEQLARISTLAKRIRQEVGSAGGFCALWDAGDVEDPTLFESQVTKGSAALALLRAAGYELAALGNSSPVRYGHQVIPELASRFGRPLLCANLFDPATNRLVAGLEPFSILTIGPLKVGVIGFTAPMSLYSVFQVEMGDPMVMLPGLVEQVRALGARTVVLLSHLGFNHNPQADVKVAEQVTGIDLIIGGHSHDELNSPIVVNGTIIAQTGMFGRYLGRVDLDIDEESGRILQHHGELIPVGAEVPTDPIVLEAYAAEQVNVQKMLAHVIGVLEQPLDWAEDRECAAGNLLADVLLDRWKGAQAALVLAGHWRGGLPAGTLTRGGLTEALRSTANPARIQLTGAQILQFLNTALIPENAARLIRPLRGVAVGMPHVAGMTVRRDPVSLALIDVRIGGEILQPERKYVVAATDLEFSDLVGYLAIPDDEIEYEVPTIIPEIVEEYVARHSPLGAVRMHRTSP